MDKMIFDDNDMFDTPYTRYLTAKFEFQDKYSNPKAWRHNPHWDTEGSKEYVKACNELLVYVEKSKEFGELDPRIKEDLAVDNLHLIQDLHLPTEMWRKLWLVDGLGAKEYRMLTPEEKIEKIVKFFESEKSFGFCLYELNYQADLFDARGRNKEFKKDVKATKRNAVKVDDNKAKNDREEENERLAAELKRRIQFDKIRRTEIKILNFRKKLYNDLNEGKNVFSMLKSFEYKVNKFLRDYGKDLDDDYEEMWKTKIIITKKAAEKFRRESEALKEAEENEKLEERAETSARKEAEDKEKLEERAEVTNK